MRYLIIIAALLAAFNASAQFVRGAGVGYTSGAPSHNPGSLGSPQAIDTITGYWYQYEYGAGTWRQAGFWLQPTNASGAPSYTPAKQRQLFAINSGDSIYYYRSGAWRLLNGPPVAGTNIDVSGRTISLDTLGLVLFKTDQSYADGVGSFGWDADAETFTLGLTTDVKLQLGQETHYHVLNDTAATLLNGRVVRATGTTGNSGKLKARYFTASGAVHGRYVLGVVTADITQESEGYVTHFGLVRGINASGSPYGESWAEGDVLYAHPTIAGGLTKTEPSAPNERVVIAIVVSNSASQGSIFVRPQFPWDLGELGNVNISNPTNGQALTYNSATGIWQNSSSAAGISYSDTTSLIATQHYVNSRGFLTAEVDGSTTNELQTLSANLDTIKLTNSATSVAIKGAGINTASTSGNTITITGTEVDGSTTNEIQLIDTLAIVSDSLRVSLNNNGAAYTAVALSPYKQTLSVSGDSLFISNGNGVQLPPTTIDTATYLTQDTILIYYANGIEFGRDTIRPAAGGASLSGGVADYLVQWTGASSVDTAGVIWTGGRLGVRTAAPAATLEVMGSGSTSATSSLLVDNSAGRALLQVKDDGAIEIGRNATGTTQETASVTVAGSETNIGLALVPKGTGAITADIPDGTAAGGNARGNNSVDLQILRAVNTQVASGNYSAIVGGFNNRASGQNSFIGGGESNVASNQHSVAFGTNCASSGLQSYSGGSFTTSSGQRSFAHGQDALASANHAVAFGLSTTASGAASLSVGDSGIASGDYSTLFGRHGRAYLYGQNSNSSGRFTGTSDAQTSNIRYRNAITGTAKTELFLDGTSVRAVLALPTGATSGRLWNSKIQVVAIVTVAGSADTIVAGSSFIGNYAVGIKRIGNTTSLVGSVQDLHTAQADNGMADSVVTIDADDTNEALRIQFTPPADAESNTVIRVVATVYLTEVGY